MIELDANELVSAFGRSVDDVRVEPIDPHLRVHSVTGGVYRVTADDDSLVIKVVQHGEDADPSGMWVSGAQATHRNYWKREWLAFDSGRLDDLPGELRAPKAILTTEPSERESWIWMEDVEGRPGASWQPADYASAAFDLGTTQGAYAAGRATLPDDEWLSRRWLRGWVDASAARQAALDDDALWDDPQLEVLRPLRSRGRAVWAAREVLLDIVESAPQTLVHNDFWPTNMIAADDGTTVAVDWSQVGLGAIGQDIDQMILDPIWMQVLPGGSAGQLEDIVVPAYTAGLRRAGFTVSTADIHRWYAAAGGIHYSVNLGAQALAGRDADRVAAAEQRWQRGYQDILSDRADVIDRALELAESALSG